MRAALWLVAETGDTRWYASQKPKRGQVRGRLFPVPREACPYVLKLPGGVHVVTLGRGWAEEWAGLVPRQCRASRALEKLRLRCQGSGQRSFRHAELVASALWIQVTPREPANRGAAR